MTEAIVLARAQFAFTLGLHIILPAFSIGLASYLMVLEALWLWTGKQVYRDLFNYWLKMFAIGFAMGVVSGVVMSYEFGTNWARFSDRAGPVIGPLMGYEVLTAFFLEAGFLGVMLFGQTRVGPRLHFFASCCVAAGTLMSAFWILAANSWMQTPAGYAIDKTGRFVPTNWGEVVFNPSFPYRFFHMVLACYLCVALLVGAVGAWHLLRDSQNSAARVMFSMAMWMAAIVAPLQLFMGDQHGLNTAEYQPAKVAAMEGDFQTTPGSPLILFGMPDSDKNRTDFAVEIPHASAIILTHSWNGAVRGLDQFPRQDWPPVAYVFWAFRVMVALGLLMIALGWWSLVQRARGRLYSTPLLWRAAVVMGPAGFMALLSGWTVTEVGRQPFTVYGLMRTADSASPIAVSGVAASLIAFIVVYFIVFGAGFLFILRLMARPPVTGEAGPEGGAPVRSSGITPMPSVGGPAVGEAPAGGD